MCLNRTPKHSPIMPSRQFQHQVPQIWAIQSITCHERLQNLNGGEHLLPNKKWVVNNKMNININPKKIRNRENVPVLTPNVLAQSVLTSNVLAQSVLTSNVLAPSVLTSSLLAHEAGVLCGLLSKTTVFETCNCFWRNRCKCSEKNGANLPPHPDMPAECACSQPLH